jgi:hypothetical protein
MNFEEEINRLKETPLVMAEIQRRQAEVQENAGGNPADAD